jgi:hypothetical protein
MPTLSPDAIAALGAAHSAAFAYSDRGVLTPDPLAGPGGFPGPEAGVAEYFARLPGGEARFLALRVVFSVKDGGLEGTRERTVRGRG